MRAERIIESHAEREEWRRLFDKIGKLLFDNGLQPNPINFELCHRYLTGRDRDLIAMVDRAIREGGGLTGKAVETIMAQRDSRMSADDLERMTVDFSGVIDHASTIVSRSGQEARNYGAALASTAAVLEDGAHLTPTVDALMGLTRSMIDKARAAENELQRTEIQMKALRDDLAVAQRTANSDPLTGLPNRRAFDQHLRAALERARRTRSPMSLAICDIDHFKVFNDTHGHQIGDEVIKFVGTSLARSGQADMFVARYGGEEFVAVFDRLAPAEAGTLLDKVRAAIASRELKVTNTGQSLGKLTFSAGIAAFESQDSPGSILKRADEALYRAKEAGRNRVLIAD